MYYFWSLFEKSENSIDKYTNMCPTHAFQSVMNDKDTNIKREASLILTKAGRTLHYKRQKGFGLKAQTGRIVSRLFLNYFRVFHKYSYKVFEYTAMVYRKCAFGCVPVWRLWWGQWIGYYPRGPDSFSSEYAVNKGLNS